MIPGRKEEWHISKAKHSNLFGRLLGGRTLALAAAVVLAVGGMVSGTVAWLVSETHTLKNTFTYGKIAIDLTEDDSDGDGDPTTNSYQMMPGINITKNPTVTVTAGWLI